MKRVHDMPFGAEVLEAGRARFRLWAPSASRVELALSKGGASSYLAMEPRGEGWYETVAAATAGTRYRFRIDGRLEVPDPASRYNPEDVHGPSVLVDPAAFDWNDDAWRGRRWEEAVVYELHVGTFTPEGTFAAAAGRLDYLVALGVTAVEIMPISDFPGGRNWGYDGVLLFAPDAVYGTPDDLKRFVSAAHARGLMVLLDVVYNHFGPDGNYLHVYAKPFFTERHPTPWGAGLNFDSNGSRTVRDYFIHNALYWIEEYHMDGLRLDAVHAIADDSPLHILEELAGRVRSGPGRLRQVHLVLENDRNQARFLEAERGPARYDAQWNDDLHHAFHVLLTGESDGYYADYADRPARRLGRALAEGFAYQGEPSGYRGGEPRGEISATLPPTAFVSFLQNHDLVGNRAFGERLSMLADEEALRAATCAWLLAPPPPLLFMGEEFGAATPFLFFCDFSPDLSAAVSNGRRKEFERFARFANADALAAIPDPAAQSTFMRSKLDWSCLARDTHSRWLELYRRLLSLRRDHIMPLLTGNRSHSARYTECDSGAFIVEWTLGNRTRLEIRSNLSGRAGVAPRAPEGAVLHCEPPASAAGFAAGRLPARASSCYIIPGEAA